MKSIRSRELSKHVRARRADARDADVGRKVRVRRIEQGLSQTQLGERCGVTFQQIQKYEKGVNRIGAGRLQRICEALDVPASYFMGGEVGDANSIITELAQDRGALAILKAYKDLTRGKRAALVETAKQMGA